VEPLSYSETISLPTWTKLLFAFVVAVFPLVLILQWISGAVEPVFQPIFLLLDVFFFLVYLNFRKLRIDISDEEICVSFGIIQRRISVKSILSYDIITARLGVYGGNGIRYGGDGSLAYLTNFGRAVKLSLKEGRPFVFSTNNPEKIVLILTPLKAH
jgi:hypothetical protein